MEEPCSQPTAVAMSADESERRSEELQRESYDWIEVNASLIQECFEAALADRTGCAAHGQEHGDKCIGFLDVRQQNGASLAGVSFAELAETPTWVTYDEVNDAFMQVLFNVFFDEWKYPEDYAFERAIAVSVLLGGVGGIVLAFGDVPSASGFKQHAITGARWDFVHRVAFANKHFGSTVQSA